ncbi:Uncharacterized protein conserved in bacteria [uncultured Clostridium sp.]|nr:Uncharacterized protein conserved in bacteria [uncultured Clostridium sp.]
MPATITGVVYDDLDRNGQFDGGEPGIPGVSMTLYRAVGSCTTVQTDAFGRYSFSVAAAGSYTIYEPVVQPTSCPPSAFPQPAGYLHSNTPRKADVTVTAAQVESNAEISGQNFGHDALSAPLPCSSRMIQFVGRPTNWYDIDLVTGQSVLRGAVDPAHDVNAIGYSPLDNYLYGYDQTTNNLVRVDGDGTLTQLTRPNGMPAAGYNTGTFDAAGFFYLYINDAARYYTVDLRPGSATYLKLVDPRAGYVEQAANYGTPLSSAVNISDWAYDPADGNLYGVQRNGVLTRIVPTTGQVTALSTTAPNPNASFGAVVIDSTGTVYAIANNDGTVYRYTHSGNTAVGVPFSTTFFASFNDGAICPRTVVEPTADLQMTKTADPNPATAGGPLTYSIKNYNNGPDPAQDAQLTDTVPQEMLSPQFSMDGGSTWQPWTGSTPLGDIPAGDSVTVLIRGTVDPAATGSIVNTAVVSSPTFDPDLSNNTDTVEVPVGEEADLSLLKLGAPKPARPGDRVTYTFAVGNAGPSSAVDVTLEDQQPAGLDGLEWSLDNGATWQPWSPTLPLGTLIPGVARVVLLRGVVSPAAGQTIVNTAAVTSPTPDPDPSNNTSTDITPVDLAADLAVTKTGAPSPVSAGGVLTYTVEVSNLGPADGQNVRLTDPLPDQLSNGEYSLDGVTFRSWTGSLSLGTLPAGGARTVVLRGTVRADAAETIQNTVTITSDTPDPDPTNNTATELTPVNTAADLAVTKIASPNPAIHGQLLTYSILVQNLGPDPAVDGQITDMLPALLLGQEFSLDNGASWQPWTGSYALGTIANGRQIQVLIRGTVSMDAEGLVENTATVSSSTPDPDPGNNSDTVRIPVDVSADLAVVKTGLPVAVRAGEPLVYTMIVTNAGPSAAQDVELADQTPGALLGPELSVDGGITWVPWSSPYPLRTLLPGDNRTVLIRGTVSPSAQAGPLSNTAVVSSTTPDPNPDNNTDTAPVEVEQSADLSVVKEGGTSPAVPGQQFQYTITVGNSGPSDGQNVILTDSVPAALLGQEFSLDNGATWAPWSSPYGLGILPAGQSRSVLLRGTVSTTAGDTLVNTAVVASTTPDPDPSNNSSTDVTPVLQTADLAVVKTGPVDPVQPGQSLTYTILVTNRGPSTAQGVILADITPPELSNVEFSLDGGATWGPWSGSYPIGELPEGGARSFLIQGGLAVEARTSVTNTAVVSGTTPDPDPTNNSSTSVVPIAGGTDLQLSKWAPGYVQPCQTLVYVLQVTNLGPETALQVVVTDQLPAELNGVMVSPDGGGTWQPWIGSYELGDIPSGQSRSLLLAGQVDACAQGVLVNRAAVTALSLELRPEDNEASAATVVWRPWCQGPMPRHRQLPC